MLSYTDLLRVSYADAVDDDDNVESIVLICLPYDKWWQRNSSHFADKHHKEDSLNFIKKRISCFASMRRWTFGRIVTTTDVIKFFWSNMMG
jgi:predicted KAP-like P-loop ATPase